MYYCNARYYSPKWRRFISPDDTAYLDPESVNGLNLYCYCNNDPVNYYDPSGNGWETVFDIGFAIGSLADLIRDPSWENAGWFALDVVCLLVPFVPSLGAGKVLTRADDIKDAAAFVSRYDNVIVLGQSMKSRVIPYAIDAGASFYGGLSSFAELQMKYGNKVAAVAGYIDNMGYIAMHTMNGAKFIDRGFDAGRSIFAAALLGKEHFWWEVVSVVTIHSEKFIAQLLTPKNVYRIQQRLFA